MKSKLRSQLAGGLAAAILSACLTDEVPGEFQFTNEPEGEGGSTFAKCAPGHTISCACPGDEKGIQTCSQEGTYGECDCGVGVGGSSGQGGTGGGAGGVGGAGGSVGAGCTVFPDCDGCVHCFESCICQSQDVEGCQDICLGGGGAGGSSGSGPGGSGPGGGPATCVVADCPDPALPVGAGCCSATDRCGYSIDFIGPDCIDKDQPGRPDSRCPTSPPLVMGITLEGCCKPGGTCGYLDGFLGLGCVDPSQFGFPSGSCG